MFVVIFAVWLILNGRMTLEVCIFGIVIAAIIYAFICTFTTFSIKKDFRFAKKALYVIEYLAVLWWEIIKANIEVIKIIFNKKKIIHQSIVYFDIDLKTEMAKVMLANSITLTPGTISVTLQGNRYCVHCLDKKMADGIENSKFVELLKKIEA